MFRHTIVVGVNRYRAPFTAKAWMDKFKHVVGIIHTNYLIYTRSYVGGAFKEPLLYYVNQGMCRAYCHKIIKLSGELPCESQRRKLIAVFLSKNHASTAKPREFNFLFFLLCTRRSRFQEHCKNLLLRKKSYQTCTVRSQVQVHCEYPTDGQS